ncbi:MAG: hypothetical protein K2H84_03845, partial [Paramuribaculum sp.]|nr:hypothetical protein [Paramuribaculum sp.]
IKEISRRQRTRPRPRMTKIKRFIKDIASLNADAEAVTDIMTFAIERMCAAGSNGWIKDSTQKSTVKLLHDTIVYARLHGEYAPALNRLEAAIADMNSDIWWSRDFKKLLADELADTKIAFDSTETTP